MNLLLDVSFDLVVALLIFVGVIIISIVISISLKKKFGDDRAMVTKNEPKSVNVELKKPYLENEEMVFLKNLYKILPAEFIAFPRVGVDNLVKPKNDKILYNTILSQYIDVAVFFKSTMEPVLVIDLYSPSPVKQSLKQLSPNVKKALQAVKIPIIEYELNDDCDLLKLKTKVIDALPQKMIAMLTEKIKN